METTEECKKVSRKIMEKKELKRRKEDQTKTSKAFKKEIKLHENIELNKAPKVPIIVKLILYISLALVLVNGFFLFWRNKNEFCVC